MSKVVATEKRLAYIRRTLEQKVAAAWRMHGKETIWSSYDRLMLESGVPFCGRVRSEDDPLLRAWRKKNRPKKKGCFENAQKFALDPDSGCSAVYHEGYALGLHQPFVHGWAVLEDGRVVDFTLDVLDEVLRREGAEPVPAGEVVYLGVPVPRKALRAFVAATGCHERMAHVHHLGMERFP
jgi:hypothetical protein